MSKHNPDILDKVEEWFPGEKVTRLSPAKLQDLHERLLAGEVSGDDISKELLSCAVDVVEAPDETN